MQYDDHIDLSTIDLRSLSPEQWTALKKEIDRRAHRGRDRAIGIAVGGILAWVWRMFANAFRNGAACARHGFRMSGKAASRSQRRNCAAQRPIARRHETDTRRDRNPRSISCAQASQFGARVNL